VNAQTEPRPEPKAEAKPATAALVVRKDIVDTVMARVAELQKGGGLRLPPNYSPENALMSAWLVLQTTRDADKKPVLETCTRTSIANCLLDMVIQGLSMAKDQGYPIAYGSALTFQRSYFGTAAIVKRVTGALDVYAEVVYQDDEFLFDLVRGNTIVTKHVRALANINRAKIVAAYCTVAFPDRTPYTQVMNLAQIHEAWKMAKPGPFDDKGQLKPTSPHARFPEEMCKRTVINRTCKMLVNSSDDSSLDPVVQAMNRADETAEEAAFAREVAENANGETLEAVVRDAEPAAETEAADAPKAGRPQAQATGQEPSW
jgi:recombination protein RecT